LDATHSQQGGTLATQVPPDFGYGLVLSAETTDLEEIPSVVPPVADEHSETAVSVAPDGSASLAVTTTFARDRADEMRDELAGTSLKELGERYANYYQSEFPDMEVLKPLAMHDERLANRIVLSESYQVPKFWRDGERSLYTEATDGYLKLPHVVRRTLPLSLSYPVWIEDVFKVVLPFRSGVQSRNDASTDGIFKFSRDIHNDGAKLVATFEYRSLAEEVPVAQVPAHLEALQRARDWNTINLADESAESEGVVHEASKQAPTSLKGLWFVGALALGLMLWPAGRGLRGLRRRREFKRRQVGRQGESPAEPASASTRAAAEVVLGKLACNCGQPLSAAPVEWTALRYQGAALHAGRVVCPRCGDAQRRYFSLEGSEQEIH
jgi:hypothetical protein